jgi:DNA damage-binding protein 1
VGESIATCSFDGGLSDVYVVGTASVVPGEEDIHKGRILVLQLTNDKKLALTHAKSIDGSPYCIQPMDNKILVAVNGTINVYEWGSHGLNCIYSHRSNTIIVDMAVNGNQIVVADLMRSISKLEYDNNSCIIREIAVDQNSNWMTSISVSDNNIVVGAEVGYNLFTLAQLPHNDGEDVDQFEMIGEWHLGEFVNRFRKGKHADCTIAAHNESLTKTPGV